MRHANHTLGRKRFAGFTIIELMITLTIAGVLLGLAVPNMRDFVRNNRLSNSANELLRSLQRARSEAIKLQLAGTQSVIVCASADPLAANPVCSYGNFTGWIVFQDTSGNWQHDAGEPLLEQHNSLDPAIHVVTNNSGSSGVISYIQTGFANPVVLPGLVATTNIVMCDERGTASLGGGSTLSYGRAIIIANTGRAHVASSYVEVSTAMGVIGGAC